MVAVLACSFLALLASNCGTTSGVLGDAKHKLSTRKAMLGVPRAEFTSDLVHVTVYTPKAHLSERAADRFARGANKAASLFPMQSSGGCGKAMPGVLLCPVTMAADLW